MESYLARQRPSTGFTLVELSIVLVLLGLVLTMGLKMVVAMGQNAALSETKAKEERVKLALLGYLRMNGYLPCPDESDNSTIATGVASPGGCKNHQQLGVVPWQTLGISRDDAI